MGNEEPRCINQPQSVVLLPDFFMFIAGGMNLALGLGWSFYQTSLAFQYCWFIAFICGALLASPLTTILAKRHFVLISSFFVTVAGIIFTAAPFNYNALIAARCINGAGIGLATVSFIVYAGEIAVDSNRGFCLTFEQFGIALGICIQSILTSQWTFLIDFSVNRVHGIFCLVFGLIALALAYLVIESPIYYLRHGDDAGALEMLKHLQRPGEITTEMRSSLEALKDYVFANQRLSWMENFMQSIGPLLKMIIDRSLLAFSFALPFSLAMQYSSIITVGSHQAWPMILYGILRLLGAMSSWSMLDLVGRKLICMISVLIVGGLSIGVAWVFENVGLEDSMRIACILLLLTQIFDGMFAPTTTTYLAEAFPLRSKPFCIAFCVIVEQIVHIVVICTFEVSINNYCVFSIFTWVYMLVAFVLFCVVLPETKDTSLKEAQDRFRRLNSLRMF